MKVGSALDAFMVISGVRNDPDGGGFAGNNAYERQQKKKEENKDFEKDLTEEQKAARVRDEVARFKGEAYAVSNGLEPSMEGKGPGLRVVLKDGRGAIVRQFTGEEFLKMREAAESGHRQGKILDQKV